MAPSSSTTPIATHTAGEFIHSPDKRHIPEAEPGGVDANRTRGDCFRVRRCADTASVSRWLPKCSRSAVVLTPNRRRSRRDRHRRTGDTGNRASLRTSPRRGWSTYLNRPIARAMTRVIVISDTADCTIMIILARIVYGMTSVGLNAVALV